MGGCSSSLSAVSPHSGCSNKTIEQFTRRLKTGDIVFLLDGSKGSRYLFRAGSIGGWSRAAAVGFLVREGPTPTDLALYHADLRIPSHPTFCRVVRSSLQDELHSGAYHTAVVRRLHHSLTPAQIQLVEEFAALNRDKVAPEEGPCSVLMANACGSVATAYERMACSEFVAMMLQLVGCVEPTDIPGEFSASTAKGLVVGSPMGLKLKTPTAAMGHHMSAPPIKTKSGRSSVGDLTPGSLSSTSDASTTQGTPQSASPQERGHFKVATVQAVLPTLTATPTVP